MLSQRKQTLKHRDKPSKCAKQHLNNHYDNLLSELIKYRRKRTLKCIIKEALGDINYY